jgi:hypothetical protein
LPLRYRSYKDQARQYLEYICLKQENCPYYLQVRLFIVIIILPRTKYYLELFDKIRIILIVLLI